jgi:hypothetical protein
MNFDFVEVFTRAAKITWKYKVLWIFGILASCGRSSGGNSNYRSSGNEITDNPLTPEMMSQLEALGTRIVSWFEQNPWIIFVFIAFVLLSIILQIFFSIVGTAGLARGVVRVENGAESLPFGELFSESLGYFWRLFGAALIIWLLVIIIFILIMFAMIIPAMSDLGNNPAVGGIFILVFISLCCCMFPVSIALNLYNLQVNRSITVEDKGLIDSLSRGWQVFSKNIVILLIIGVVIFIASFIIGVLIALPLILMMVPLIESFIQGNITSWQPFIAVGIFAVCYSPIAWLINGIVMTYIESVWTLTYLRLIKPKEEAPVFVEANA